MLGYLSTNKICSEKHSLQRMKPEENSELQGTYNFQGQLFKQIFEINGGS